ncbi:MAG: dihydroorotate dehydrogenase-like protein [Anaerolineales bacterium]|nr:dihydroorotate dehydrogenase-like protein [Anaerolineales bacterium]
MSNLETTYLGLKLKTPIIAAASSISSQIDRIQQAEKAGAGALVIRSLFEEQILQEALKFEEDLAVGSESFAEALSYFPNIEFGDAGEHLMWIRKTREAVDFPLIASLNAYSPGTWVKYAHKLEETGVDALELNPYAVAVNPKMSGADIEKTLYDVVKAVVNEVKIPVSVKLSPYFTSLMNVAGELEGLGVSGLVLFNRFLQPDIDADKETVTSKMTYSNPYESLLPLRWVALMSNTLRLDLAHNTGIHTGKDAARALLAGASVVQVASVLYRQGIPYLSTMLHDLEAWMEERGYSKIEDFRGKLSAQEVDDPFTYERAQYVNLLLDQK